MKYDYDESVVVKDRTNIENSPLSWTEAFKLFATDLPSLADRINNLTEETENLW